MRKPYILCSFIFVLMVGSTVANAEQVFHFTSEIDTPTAYTIGRGNFDISMLAYDGGGLEFKAFMGLHDNFFLGASVDVAHAVGKEKAEPNIPGVIAKIKFTDGWETFPVSFAAGYDSFYLGTPGKVGYTYDADKLNRMIYGPYFVITKPIYLLDSEQHINWGLRVPAQPHFYPKETSYFLSFDVPMGEFFTVKGEWERVYYNFKKPSDWLYNLGMRYTYMKIGIEFDFMMQEHERVNRIIKVEYINAF
jgi:hypothetical protein